MYITYSPPRLQEKRREGFGGRVRIFCLRD
jgi:hypothetical protein